MLSVQCMRYFSHDPHDAFFVVLPDQLEIAFLERLKVTYPQVMELCTRTSYQC